MPKPRYLFVACYSFPIHEETQEFLWESSKPSEAAGIQDEADPENTQPYSPAGQIDARPSGGAIPEDCMEYEPSDYEVDPESGKPGGIPVGVTDDEGVPECDPESGRPGRMPVEMTDDEGVPEADDGVPEADDAGFLDKEAVDAVPKVCRVCQEEADENTSSNHVGKASVGHARLCAVLPRRVAEILMRMCWAAINHGSFHLGLSAEDRRLALLPLPRCVPCCLGC